MIDLSAIFSAFVLAYLAGFLLLPGWLQGRSPASEPRPFICHSIPTLFAALIAIGVGTGIRWASTDGASAVADLRGDILDVSWTDSPLERRERSVRDRGARAILGILKDETSRRSLRDFPARSSRSWPPPPTGWRTNANL